MAETITKYNYLPIKNKIKILKRAEDFKQQSFFLLTLKLKGEKYWGQGEGLLNDKSEQNCG